MTTRISYIISFLTGLGLIFIGARFLLTPQNAEIAYGISLNTHADFSFHYIKGVRDLFTGVLLLVLVIFNEKRALAITLLAATIVPFGDMLIVLSKDYNTITEAIPHIIAVIICITIGPLLLIKRSPAQKMPPVKGFIKIVRSADKDGETIVESNLLPGDRTPWHYHTLFAETFEIIKGNLEVGKNKEIHHLKPGDNIIIEQNETHYFNNKSGAECIIRTILKPGNKNFENASLILKGLARDGFTTGAGIPRKLSDLALFIHLNNSKMTGFQRIAEPLFKYLAKRAIKTGRLDELEKRYCSSERNSFTGA